MISPSRTHRRALASHPNVRERWKRESVVVGRPAPALSWRGKRAPGKAGERRELRPPRYRAQQREARVKRGSFPGIALTAQPARRRGPLQESETPLCDGPSRTHRRNAGEIALLAPGLIGRRKNSARPPAFLLFAVRACAFAGASAWTYAADAFRQGLHDIRGEFGDADRRVCGGRRVGVGGV
jgi:hypothetical protein